MKRFLIGVLCAFSLSASFAQQDGVLEGDEGLACEAILCLAASGVRPGACLPSIRRYFSIVASKPWKTITARFNFLSLCPVRSADMDKFINALAHGSGNCDASTLNTKLRVHERGEPTHIANAMPEYCLVYATNPYTEVKLPRYVGKPERGGMWADPENYEIELASYNARIAREQAEANRR